MHKAMLLLNALPVGKMDFGAPVLNDGQRSLIRCITFCRSKLSRTRSAKCGSEKQGSRRVAGSLRCRGCCQVLKPRGRPKSGRARTLISLRATGDIGALEGHRSWLANTDGRSVVESSLDCRVALLFSSAGRAARVGSIPIARSTFRCLASPCVAPGRDLAYPSVPTALIRAQPFI
jgi:hypothetical protein